MDQDKDSMLRKHMCVCVCVCVLNQLLLTL